VQVEATECPPALEVPGPHTAAFVLIRWKGTPVGQAWLPVTEGRIGGDVLEQAILANAGERIAERRLIEFLDHGSPPTGLPLCTVAICTRDRPDDLVRCLAGVCHLGDGGHEILVIDSASQREVTRTIASRHAGVRYLREESPGLDRARNRALREARHPIVALTDDDAVPDPGWLGALAAGFGDRRTMCVTGLTLPLELDTPAQEWFERTNGFGRGYRPAEYDGIECDPFFVARVGAGVNMALRRSVLDLVGPFDESLDAGTPTRSGGDHDMFTRILASGYRIVYQPEAASWHRHRREWPEVAAAVRGYGTGVYAYLTKQLGQREFRAPFVAAAWLPRQLARLVGGWLRRSESPPVNLTLAELRGCWSGPRSFFRSRRLQRPHE